MGEKMGKREKSTNPFLSSHDGRLDALREVVHAAEDKNESTGQPGQRLRSAYDELLTRCVLVMTRGGEQEGGGAGGDRRGRGRPVVPWPPGGKSSGGGGVGDDDGWMASSWGAAAADAMDIARRMRESRDRFAVALLALQRPSDGW